MFIDFMQETARQAGEIIRGYFGNIRSGSPKGEKGDLVTQADLESERLIVDKIHERFPDHGILAEEGGWVDDGGAEFVWMVDPLDGTRNFSKAVPIFCVSIGLLRYGQPVEGIVYDPIHDEMLHAEQNRGSWLNDRRLHVSDVEDLAVATINVAWSKNEVGDIPFSEYAVRLVERTSYTRRYGSAALAMAYVADSRLDGAILLDLNPWDVAAGTVIVTEAGGVVTDFSGNQPDLLQQSQSLIAANPMIHERLLEEIFLLG